MIILSRRRCWLVFGGTGSVWGGTGWHLLVLGPVWNDQVGQSDHGGQNGQGCLVWSGLVWSGQ